MYPHNVEPMLLIRCQGEKHGMQEAAQQINRTHVRVPDVATDRP